MTLPVANGLAPVRPQNPADLGFPPMLPVELAMRTAPVPEICAAYGVSKFDLEMLILDPIFVQAYNNAVEALKKDGMSFKLKAQLQAEELLKVSYKMINDKETPNAVRADLIKSTVRWAGYEPKGEAAGGGSSSFNIQINLG